jgi:hypothetical protein
VPPSMLPRVGACHFYSRGTAMSLAIRILVSNTPGVGFMQGTRSEPCRHLLKRQPCPLSHSATAVTSQGPHSSRFFLGLLFCSSVPAPGLPGTEASQSLDVCQGASLFSHDGLG